MPPTPGASPAAGREVAAGFAVPGRALGTAGRVGQARSVAGCAAAAAATGNAPVLVIPPAGVVFFPFLSLGERKYKFLCSEVLTVMC